MHAENLPKLFIGSSSESKLLLDILMNKLKADATITPWTDRSIFRPARFYVDDLLRIPHLFDFGLFLFEPDDTVVSRGIITAMPRDNVIFELGLFMSRLGLKRAFAMAPRNSVKILSDIAGLKLIEYDESDRIKDIRSSLATQQDQTTRKKLHASLRQELKKVLKPAIEDIKELLRQGVIEMPGVFPDAPNVMQIGDTVERLVKASIQLSGSASIRHLALDMSEAWGIITEEILNPKKGLNNVQWRCLMIDPESVEIQKVASSSVAVDIAVSRVKQMLDFLDEKADSLAGRNLSFECRVYTELPAMHGFLIDNTALLWSICDIDIPYGKLNASYTPYWRFEATDQSAPSSHPARAFANWFEYRWNRARLVAGACFPVSLSNNSRKVK
jgi:hypothetical protein